MKIKNKRIIKIILAVLLFIIILLLFSIYLGKVKNYAKYSEAINSTGSAEIAKPVFEVDGDSSIKIDGIDDTTYVFSVKNYNQTDLSHTDLDYYIEIINNSEANLEFELLKNDVSVVLNNNKSDNFKLIHSNNQEDIFKLKIKYQNNPAIENDIDGNVQIKVEAVQSKAE